jgi:type IV pilus assembly protein PilW
MRVRGLTLVELLIAVLLGSVLCLAGATLLVKAKQVYLQDEQLARVQENGTYALRLLYRELAMAGYFGEALPGDVAPAPPGGSECYQHLVQLQGEFEHYDNISRDGVVAGGPGLPRVCSRPGDHLDGSDILLVRRVMDLPALHWGELLEPTSDNMLYLRYDRRGAALKRGASGLLGDGSLWRFHPQLFFLRNYSRVRGDGTPALCRIRLSPGKQSTAPVECLVEGVEQMQFEFGIDSNGDRRADRYVSTLTPEQVGVAVVARIQLLVRSPLPVPGHRDNISYSIGNAKLQHSADGYFRRVLGTSVLLRNSDVHRG